ncbi:hypothetical protein NNJEOMEG_00771 [Fundidesulfovibrio magnetotacticus]|uniref:Spore protein YkvP/CgeB glycosyl transferase-like domain-containing protein n=1 Tax=Fundidesulfovibrio magnetotacticus TaxID=2730080 RepID=A0A6V8LJP6_9BACT|nr:glycosyltransferase [Fundidesulfovibrio magnetotacticus]GFK92943.1 hypothetical protein NNJEOMEG_00771 [Fundidesulfovibrio magnetotacticus]
MRVLCLDGPYFLKALERLGCETLSVGQWSGADVRLEKALSLAGLLRLLDARGFEPEAALWADDGRPPSVAGLELLPWPTIAYSIDQYLNPWHVPFCNAFDAALVAQKDYLPLFAPEHKGPLRWMPLFADPLPGAIPPPARDIPASFVGTLDSPANPGRRPFLEAFRRHAPLAVLTGDYRSVFARSRLALNQSAAGELNFRVFQAMAEGAALLTEDAANGLRDLFTPGRHLLVYPRGDHRAAAALAQQALADPGLEELARAGQAEVLARHRVDHRAQEIVRLFEELARAQVHRARFSDMGRSRRLMATAYRILATDPQLPLPPELRAFYLELAHAGGDAR